MSLIPTFPGFVTGRDGSCYEHISNNERQIWGRCDRHDLACLAVRALEFIQEVSVRKWKDSLEIVWSLLPGPVALNPNLDTSEYHLLSTTKVNAQLHDVSVLDGKELRLRIWLAQSDVV